MPLFPLPAVELAAALLAQDEPTQTDFRAHVWFAYAIVLVLLALFTLWTLMKVKKLNERLELLGERFDKAHPEERQPSGERTSA